MNQVLKEHFEELLKEPMRTVLYTFIPILFLIPSLSNLLAQNLINLDDYTTSVGCRGVYIGSYDDVYVLNSIENVTGEALSIDGTPVGACYTEVLLSKKIGGIQSFRYEVNYNPLENINEAQRVNPFDERGKSSAKSNFEDKKATIQRLSSDIAPFGQLPELVISFREDYFHSMIKVKSTKPIKYIPYDNSTSSINLNPDTDYYVDIVLEEINISWNFSFLKIPSRISYFDLIYQKPVLLVNNINKDTYDYNLNSPKFFIQGAQLDFLSIPIFDSFDAKISYGYSLGNSYMIMKNEDLDSTLDKKTKVNMHRFNLGINYQLSKKMFFNYFGEFMWIKLDSKKYNNQTISLDAINNISFFLIF